MVRRIWSKLNNKIKGSMCLLLSYILLLIMIYVIFSIWASFKIAIGLFLIYCIVILFFKGIIYLLDE